MGMVSVELVMASHFLGVALFFSVIDLFTISKVLDANTLTGCTGQMQGIDHAVMYGTRALPILRVGCTACFHALNCALFGLLG